MQKNTLLKLTKKLFIQLANNYIYMFIKQISIIPVFFFFVILFYSCNNKNIIASVDNIELSEEDAFVIMSHLGMNPNDTIELKKFIDEWCTKEALKSEIKNEYQDTWKLIKLREGFFSGDLAKYYLEEIELKNKLDTIITKKEIESYYNTHKEEFVLQDYIVKALYLKIPKYIDFKSKNIDEIYLLKKDQDLTKLNSYAKLYAENYYFNDSIWIYFEELTKDVPVKKFNIDNIVLNRTKTYFSDDNHTYFLNIIDYKLKNDVPPLDFLSDKIKTRIISIRLQEIKEKHQDKLIKKIKNKHEIIINI